MSLIINNGVSKHYAGSQVSDGCPMGYLFQFALWHTQSLMNPSPPPPLFSFLETIQCLAVTLNLDSKCGTKDWHWCKQKCGVQFLNSPADLDNIRCLHPGSPEEAPQTSCWGVHRIDAHAYLQLSDINIRFVMKKIDQLYFHPCFVFSKGQNAFYVSNTKFHQCEGVNGEFYTTGP